MLSCVRGIKPFASKEKQNCFLACSRLNRPRGELIMKVHRYSMLFCGATTLFLADSTGVSDSCNCRGLLFYIRKHEMQGTAQLPSAYSTASAGGRVRQSANVWWCKASPSHGGETQCGAGQPENYWHCVLFGPSAHALICVFEL